MAYTIHVYEESAVTLIAKYGLYQQGKASTYWPISPYFVLLCGSNVADFDASFVGSVTEILATSVAELPTANGYVVGGKPVGFASIGGNIATSWSVPTGGTLTASSALLCYRRPDVAGAAYSISSPIAMVDFGGTVSRSAGTAFHVSWAASSFLVLDSIA